MNTFNSRNRHVRDEQADRPPLLGRSRRRLWFTLGMGAALALATACEDEGGDVQDELAELQEAREKAPQVAQELRTDLQEAEKEVVMLSEKLAMAERGVRFTQIFHRGWDQHGNLTGDLPRQCGDVDQPCAALIQDLKMRGMLDDTLVVWGGEFGRTIYCQGGLSRTNYGRDHHPRCFTVWLAGAGIKAGTVYGRTDDFSYNIVENPVHIRDLNATILHLLGIHHERLSVKRQGLDVRLTGVEKAHVVEGILG